MKRIVTGMMVIAMAMVMAMGCEKAQVTEEMTEGVEMPEGAMPEKGVSAATVVIGDKSWTVEVASTPEERTSGLGGRESLPANFGMWFVFPDDSQDPFWMKDTKFNLDMIFVGNDMKVKDIKPNNAALTETLIQPVSPYRYVLEINAGEVAGVNIGDTVVYQMGPQ